MDAKLPHVLRGMSEKLLHDTVNLDVQAFKSRSAFEKAYVVNRLNKLGPPPQFRLIDCTATMQLRRVVLVDGRRHRRSYTITSHTWGEEVYSAFDCECACLCSTKVPRSSGTPCPGAAAHGERHSRVVADILKMCERLMDAGSKFVWHDGVCIAQHNAAEVKETIQHMGWLYANATDTVIFLDYVGRPSSLLPLHKPYQTRWNRRVWTLQEAILSKRRRYCIRLVYFFDTRTMEDFEANLAYCYEDDSCIVVLEEDAFWTYLLILFSHISWLMKCLYTLLPRTILFNDPGFHKTKDWLLNLQTWIYLLRDQFFNFPTLSTVLILCAGSRDSKHKGDRINSVLGLAGIEHFVAPKDDNLEVSSIEFFKRLGQDAIREALFWINTQWQEDADKIHTWLPCLSREILCTASLKKVEDARTRCVVLKLKEEAAKRHSWLSGLFERLVEKVKGLTHEPTRCVVMENGMLELRGHLWSVAVQFTSRTDNAELPSLSVGDEHYNHMSMDLSIQFDSEQHGYKSFAKASSTKLGLAVFPVSREPGLSLGRAVIQGRVMEEGSSLLAHLVFGDFILQGDEYLAPALIIAGGKDLRAPVSRIGYFMAHRILISLIFEKNLVSFTSLDQLVIV